ncbi:hypothetical protein G6F31_021061 [Rhizopus arrhizus]|nr:hypothetical protein G6F24_018684 [Rhizopus arrhizus]KAG0919576.1 hypothetical protein G6F31_021061 [Rhizopus arrhizus]
MQRAQDVQLQERGGQAGRGREDALELVVAQRHRQHGDDDDADQDRAAHAQRVQRGDDEEAQDREQRAVRRQVAQRDLGGRMGDDDAGAR